ncbi:MAG TPA: ABC transporter permease [Opitutaceae bacterium]|nr:ABC transporter permease [Opitutaceae bacterium]
MLTLRYAFRRLIGSPGFTLVAVVILALGIGMSTSAFSVTNVILLRTMPYPNGEQLMRVFRTSGAAASLPHSPGNYLDIRAAATSFSHTAAYFLNTFNVSEGGQPPQQELVINASADFFNVLQVQPFIGHGFAPDEDRPGKGNSVVLTHAYWKNKYGGDQNVLGKVLRVGTENLTITGVLPEIFDSTPVWNGAGLIIPTTFWPDSNASRRDKWLQIVGRLKPDVSRASAQSELNVIAARLDQDYPKENGRDQLRVTGLYASNASASDRQGIWFVTALSVLVLAIACANLAGVQVARAFSRSHEYAVRSSLGANRRQLVAPLIVESLLLSLAGGAAGLGVAFWENHFTAHFNATGPVAEIPMDAHVLLFSALMAVLTGLAFGLAPALLVARRSTQETLKESGAAGATTSSRSRLKSALIVTQLALALILVSAAASFGIAARKSLAADYGWKPKNTYSATIGLPYAPYPDAKTKLVLVETLHDRMARLPGVERVVFSAEVPLYNYYQQFRVVTEGAQSLPAGQEPITSVNLSEGAFFDALNIPLKEGRTFAADVKPTDPQVAIVNETMARLLWPGQSAIGRRLRFAESDQWMEVIGVVGDVKMAGNFAAPNSRMQLYRPLVQALDNYLTVLLSGSVNPDSLDQPFRKALAEINPDITIYQSGGMQTAIKTMVASNNLTILILSAFAMVGVLISLIGLYGVSAQLTLQRTREIGVRVALGATYRSVINLIVAQGSRLVAIGLVVGLLGAYVVNRLYQQLLPELPLPGFFWQFLLCILLCAAGLLACYLPACRAARVDPMIALRSE